MKRSRFSETQIIGILILQETLSNLVLNGVTLCPIHKKTFDKLAKGIASDNKAGLTLRNTELFGYLLSYRNQVASARQVPQLSGTEFGRLVLLAYGQYICSDAL